MADDTIFSVPEALASAGVQFSTKAQDVLGIHSNLDSYSQTLHDSLPNAKSQLAIDTFWTKWSGKLLDMANEIEGIAVLLGNAAVDYLKADAAIVKAFKGNKAEQDKLNAEIQKIKDDQKAFNKKFADEKKADADVNKQVKKDKDNIKKKEQEDAAQQNFDNAVNWNLGEV